MCWICAYLGGAVLRRPMGQFGIGVYTMDTT
jgi:hypothetical protein